MIIKIILIYFLPINIITFIVYGIDKLKAKKKLWRIPEATLLLLAAIGGSIGAWLGMKVWHHKTMHKKFKYGVPAIIILQIAAVVAVMMSSCSNSKDTVKAETDTQEHLVGAYTDGREVSKEELELFQATYKGDVALTPESVSTQVVAGTNYKFICRDRNGKKYQVVIYQKLSCYGGGSEVTSVEEI